MVKDIFSMCQWTEVPFAQSKKFDLKYYLETVGWDEEGVDLWGRRPKVYLHTGDLHIPSSFIMDAQGNGVFIIDGSLTIDGTLGMYGSDANTFLLVSGDVKAKNLIQGGDTQLGVKRSLVVENSMWFDLSDVGFAVVKDTIKGKYIVVGISGDVCCDNDPEGAMLQHPLPLSDEIRSEMSPAERKSGLPDFMKVLTAAEAGVPLFKL